MTDARHIFVLAGEPSGDRLGAELLADLQAKTAIRLSGVGGAKMGTQGLQSLFPMEELSVMGFADVVRRLPLLLWRIRQMARTIMKTRPDLVLLIDSQVFSSLLAKSLRRRGYTGPVLLYVAPTVWAWKPERAPKLVPLFDEVLAILPFEPEVMDRLGGPPTTYVGHPALTAARPDQETRSAAKIALLPGSRPGEIRRHMPLMRRLCAALSNDERVDGFVLPTLPHLQEALELETAEWPVHVQVVSTPEERIYALEEIRLAIVTAGTITLELALADIPMVGTYVPDPRLMHHYEKAGRPMIALPNIILGRRLVPEIEPNDQMEPTLLKHVSALLGSTERVAAQRAGFAEMRELLENRAHGGFAKAAARVRFHLEKNNPEV